MTLVSTTRKQSRPAGPAVRFEDDLQQVVERLSSTLRTLIEAIPPRGGIRRATDLERALDIRTTLAWQVFRAANATDSLIEAANLPGPAAMKHFFDAAVRRKAPATSINAAMKAFGEFQGMMRLHAPDRAAFTSMLAGVSETDADHVSLQYRRLAFRGNSHIWGVQAKTHVACFIYQPNATNSSLIDIAGFRGMVNLQRFRRDASWLLSSTRLLNDDDSLVTAKEAEPLDPRADPTDHDVGLMREFCSQPLPEIRRVPSTMGAIQYLVEPSDIGRTAAVTCIVGHVFWSSFTRYRDDLNRVQNSAIIVSAPVETLLLDVMVAEGTLQGNPPRLLVYGNNRTSDASTLARECDLLPVGEPIVRLGRGANVARTSDVPRYVEMVRYTFDRLGWDAQRFDVYRCRMEYPIVPSSVVMQFDLLEKP